MVDYKQFLAGKRLKAKPAGFEPVLPINPKTKPFQADIVRWALRLGRAAVFAECGLGKTLMQLDWAYHVCDQTDGDVLILAPLTVGRQTQREGAKFGYDVTVCRTMDDVRHGINVTNYEMLKAFDLSRFAGVVLDESSILKNFVGKTKKALVEGFRDTPYRLCCTATPAPNDHVELQNHAEFLGIEGAGEMLARFFVHDSFDTATYRLKKHSEREFWRWVASWAVTISKPSDLGYSDEGYDLPELKIIEHIVEVDISDDTNGMLFRMADMSATGVHKEKRRTASARAKRAAELTLSHHGPWVLWCDTDYEADEFRAAVPGVTEIRGSETVGKKEAKLLAFQDGEIRTLLTKAKITGFGLNWQHCRRTVVVPSYSYETFHQLVSRFHRFGQTESVECHVVMAETEVPLWHATLRKRELHHQMKAAMIEAMKENGLELQKPTGLAPVTEDVAKGEKWTVHLGDSCQTIREVPDRSVGLTVSSPPFENLFVYSDVEADMGNCKDSREFFQHIDYLIGELLRITIPGRLCVFHCKDLPRFKGKDGEIGLRDFPGELIRAFGSHGWTFHSRLTIWKDPVVEQQRTKAQGLLYKELCKDSCTSRQGMADYLLAFRAPFDGKAPDPVGSNSERFGDYIGLEPPDPTLIAQEHGFFPPIADPKTGRWPRVNPFPEGTEAYRQWSICVWQKYASPVWFDISQPRVLDYEAAREPSDEKHICVARDSLVLTRDGHIPIQDVEVGSLVLTHQGRWRPVVAKACNGVRPIVRLEAQGVADLRITPDHLLWTRSGIGKGKWPGMPGGISHPRKTAMKSSPEWIQAAETKGSYVNLKLPPVEESPYSEHDWWVIGRWLGDGHRDARGHLVLSCGHHETDKLRSALGERAGSTALTYTAKQIRIKDRDGRLKALLERCGNYADGKKLPAEALALEPLKAEALLSGYLSADGHYVAKYDRWTASSVSRALLLGMAMVAQRARGVACSVYAGRPAGTCVIEGRTVNTKADWILSIPPRNVSGFMLDDGAWKKVRQVRPHEAAEVWDLQVAEDQSFTVEGCIVHNCPLQLDVIARAIHLWSNPGDLVCDPFNGVGSTGHEAIRLGRKYLGIELKPSYFRQAVKHLTRIEAEVNAPTLALA